jgi:hypothetical protein
MKALPLRSFDFYIIVEVLQEASLTIERAQPGRLRRLLARFEHAHRGRPAVIACFVDELTPGDERMLRTLIAQQEGRG